MAGFATNILDVSPAYAGVVMGVTLLAASVPQVGSAFLIPGLLERFHYWSVPFLVCAGVNILSALMFTLCGTGKRQDVSIGSSYLRL